METTLHQRIKMLIEETNDAYSTCGSINADYAEFASLALSEFKSALRNPRLTRAELSQMLRTGMTQHRNVDPETNWSTFMAHYITRTANKNAETMASIAGWETVQEEKA